MASAAAGSRVALQPAATATHNIPRSALRRSIVSIGSLLFDDVFFSLRRGLRSFIASIHHRLGAATKPLFDGGKGVECQSGGICSQLVARRFRAGRLASKREYERLRHTHDREFVVRIA